MSVPTGDVTFLVVTNQVQATGEVQELSEQTLPGLYLGTIDQWGIHRLLGALSTLGFQVVGAFLPVEAAQYGGYNYPGGRLIVIDSGDDDPWYRLLALQAAVRDGSLARTIALVKE